MAAGFRKARERAKALCKLNGVLSAPVPVERIAERLGAIIQYEPFDIELSGWSFVKDGVIMIGVNAAHNVERQRFTVAHEVGHLELHRARLEAEVHVDKGTLRHEIGAAETADPMEMEANAFAAEFLMPAEFLKKTIAGRTLDLEDDALFGDIARRFKVTTAALRFRLQMD